MTQRDFEALAGTLARLRPATPESDAYALWKRIVDGVADDCARSNPRFVAQRFYLAAATR